MFPSCKGIKTEYNIGDGRSLFEYLIKIDRERVYSLADFSTVAIESNSDRIEAGIGTGRPLALSVKTCTK
jgi:hypothetical protein